MSRSKIGDTSDQRPKGTAMISNRDDVIDSRDVIDALEEMTAELLDDMNGYLPDTNPSDIRAFEALRELHSQGKDNSEDWEYGATLIRDSYFVTYAQELADDLGMLPESYTWPLSCIDWEKAAEELQMDYSSVEFDGVTYWVR